MISCPKATETREANELERSIREAMRSIATLRRGGLKLKPAESGLAYGPIRNAVIPSIAVFPLLQHTGSPADCLVSPGERVREGMLIARAAGPVSASVHASIPGVVTARRPIRLPNGEVSDAITIRLEGEFERLGTTSAAEDGATSREALLSILRESGMVTLDSQAVPLHVFWKMPRGRHVETLIVSAIGEEPYLGVDQCLFADRGEALIEGAKLAITLLGPRKIVLVIEAAPTADEELPPVVRALEDAAASAGVTFSPAVAGVHYPRGSQRELVRTAMGRRLESGASPLSVGALVTNVSTLVAVRDAVHGRRPLIERYVTVAGDAIASPATLRVRIGTRLKDVIDECGGFSELPDRVVVGGPLTGSAVYDLDTPVTKNTQAVLALSKRESGGGRRAPCIECGRCLTSCPEDLNPVRLFKQIEHGQIDPAVDSGLMECIECGSCSFVCPSNIPLLETLRTGKSLSSRNGR